MDKRTLEALKGSIKKWHGIAHQGNESHGVSDCPLCAEYISNCCNGCPVREATGKLYCNGSPHDEVDNLETSIFDLHVPSSIARRELDFLIHLLPEGETAIVDGWVYGWRWK